MRVLLAAYSLVNGGLERQLTLLATRLSEPFERRVWSFEGGPYQEELARYGVPVRLRPRRYRYDVTPAVDLFHALRMWNPDVVHAWHWMPAAAVSLPCRALGIPLIDGSIRMGGKHPGFGRPRRTTMRLATLVVANSQAGLRAWGIGAGKGRVVYNAFDEARLAGIGRHSESTGSDRSSCRPRGFTAIMTARMSPQKDYRTLMEAIRLLAPGSGEDERSLRFVLVGDGADRAIIEALAQGCPPGVTVDLPPAGLEVLHLVCEADVGVVLTDPRYHAEGCCNSIMEYMACGLPVVCTDSGGNRELVEDGVTGYVVPSLEPPAVAEKLALLRADPALRRRLGEAGRRRLDERFSVGTMVAAYERLYVEAVERARRRGDRPR